MSSVESGQLGPRLVSSPTPQPDENSAKICYCPECGARVRIVSREQDEEESESLVVREPEDDGDRSTLPDWLQTASVVTPTPPGESQGALPVDAPVPSSAADIVPRVGVLPPLPELPLLATRPLLVGLRPLSVPVDSGDDEDEPTRDIRASDDYGPAALPPAEVNPAVSPSTSVEPSNTTSGAAVERARPAAHSPIVETAPQVNYNGQHVGVQSTGPTARDVSIETNSSEAIWQRRPKRAAILVAAGLGGGAAALGLALFMRGASPSPHLATVATPVAAIAESPQKQTPTLAALPAPQQAEPAELTVPAVSSKPAEPKQVAAAVHESAHGESVLVKTKLAKATTATTADTDSDEAEEEPFDAREAASAVDGAAERASACRREGDPSGVAVVTITFAPSGRVTTATLAGPPFIGTATGSCIATTMRSARVSAFSGKHVTVRKTVTIH